MTDEDRLIELAAENRKLKKKLEELKEKLEESRDAEFFEQREALRNTSAQLQECRVWQRKLINYCLTRGQGAMWANTVLGILCDCDFRESLEKARELKQKMGWE